MSTSYSAWMRRSMSPCIDAVKVHISDFVAALSTPRQQRWDVRLDFVAHKASDVSGGGARSLAPVCQVFRIFIKCLSGDGTDQLFVWSIEEFGGRCLDNLGRQ